MNPSELAAALADRYRIERELGRGGMATVYLAHDLRHDRPVALKVLRPELAQALGPERFEREIKLAARLQHPHILSVHDSGESAGQLWFTMPFVEGESLRDRLNREKQLPLDDALHIVQNVASALAFAHSHGVIHRDIKPENILLTGNEAVVADFGIARVLGGLEDRLTGTGLAIGTPAYMSPEQASGERELDARTDLYALGCVLYEMLAGEPPFTGPTAQAIMARALTETPRPLHLVRPAVPPAVDEVIAKAMAHTPADRFATAGQFAQALASAKSPTFYSSGVASGPMPAAGTAAAPGKGGSGWTARRALALASAAFVLGLGVLFAWRHGHPDRESGPRTIAVLPFENLGDSADAYFADGVTDAVRGKLTALPGLEVIARGSSNEYRHTTKRLQQIGQELQAGYLLTATVRWERRPDGTNRVQVSPELVVVTPSHAPVTKWQQPFDAALTDVFQVQADIASRVAQALDVVLSDSLRTRLAERPTQNLAAYDAYLKGEEVTSGTLGSDPASLRRGAAYYQQAVALDSTFALAWAQLSRTHSRIYSITIGSPADSEQARRAAERAVTLAPGQAESRLALGDYYANTLYDPARASVEYAAGFRIAPNHPDLLTAVAITEQSLNHWEASLAHLRQAQALDPRSVNAALGLAQALLRLRRYPEALDASDRALALAPTSLLLIQQRATVSLAQGDLAGARAVLAAVPSEVKPDALVAYIALYGDLYWILDEEQQRLLLRQRPAAFDNDQAEWAVVLAQTYALRGDRAAARTYADSAQAALANQLQSRPNNPLRVLRGLALAYLGRKTEAVQEGERGLALLPIGTDPIEGPYIQHQLVRIYILVGEYDKALDLLEPLLKVPYVLSPGWLKIDPNFDPLRGNPRFQRLVSGSP